MEQRKKIADSIVYIVLTVLAVAFLVPIFLVIMNSLKNKLYISTTPFVLPNGDSFVGLKNYVDGLTKIHFFDSVGYSLFITVFSVLAMVIFCSMTAWFITRVKSKITSGIYYMFVASMVVPFQMVMYTMTKTADALHLNNYVGIIVVYLGFGAGNVCIYVFRLCKGYPDGAGGSRTDRRLQPADHVYQGCIPDTEADLHHRCDSECNVGME